MSKLTIIARVEAHEGKAEFIKDELFKLVEATRKEAGCLRYDLHHDNENTDVFFVIEDWENHELWQQHMKNDSLAGYSKATEGAVASFTVNQMTHIK